MGLKENNLEEILFEYVDKIKVLIAPETWENRLLDCSKNELLIMLLLYRSGEVNMTQIAEYINVPLNTATGIVARMEKKELILRTRSVEDKRVVTITFAKRGREQVQEIWKEFMFYGQRIMEELTGEEFQLLQKVLDKTVAVFRERRPREDETKHKRVKRVLIE